MLLLTVPPVVAGALGGGYLLARKALAPVDRMVATAKEITSTRLDRRLTAPNSSDELGRLANTFNDMIARLQRSFDEVRRFTADAAHELRTPLASMRTDAEVALRAPRSPENDERVLENLLEEIDRLTRLSPSYSSSAARMPGCRWHHPYSCGLMRSCSTSQTTCRCWRKRRGWSSHSLISRHARYLASPIGFVSFSSTSSTTQSNTPRPMG